MAAAPATTKKAKSKAPTAASVQKKLDKVVESTNDTIGSLRDEMAQNQAIVLQAIQKLNTDTDKQLRSEAKNRIVRINSDRVEADEQDLNQVPEITNEEVNPALDHEPGVIETSRLSNVDFGEFQVKAVIEQFMKEWVIVHIHDSMDVEMPQVFDISVNGKAMVFRHGETKKIQRHYLEGLARAKPVHYTNKEIADDQGALVGHQIAKVGLRYPFSLERDDNPMGRQWLQAVLRQH